MRRPALVESATTYRCLSAQDCALRGEHFGRKPHELPWLYLDSVGKEFGPLLGPTMHEWLSSGRFPVGLELRVRLPEWDRHWPLHQLFPDLSVAFNVPPAWPDVYKDGKLNNDGALSLEELRSFIRESRRMSGPFHSCVQISPSATPIPTTAVGHHTVNGHGNGHHCLSQSRPATTNIVPGFARVQVPMPNQLLQDGMQKNNKYPSMLRRDLLPPPRDLLMMPSRAMMMLPEREDPPPKAQSVLERLLHLWDSTASTVLYGKPSRGRTWKQGPERAWLEKICAAWFRTGYLFRLMILAETITIDYYG